VVVPAGEFMMGSDNRDIESGIAAANEGPQHKVIIMQPIAVGRFEVTRDEYETFVRLSGRKAGTRCYTFENNVPQERADRSFLNPGFAQSGTHPAVCVNWGDAKAYVEWLSQTTGKAYRLLSEAEYEYAARAGSTSRYGFTDVAAEICKFANGADQSAKLAGLPSDYSCQIAPNSDPLSRPITTPSDGAMTGAAEPTQRSKPVLAGGEC
jgi:formylglycine-generating enzyme required for sulfatase activity